METKDINTIGVKEMVMRDTTTIELHRKTCTKLKEIGKKGQTYNSIIEILLEKHTESVKYGDDFY